jgi:predicted ATPase/class 3 adenylate cyclase
MSATPPTADRGVLPSGTVTFAFTDIEGSTQRWERDRAAMERIVRRHDDVVRTAIEEHRGHVFKTAGDAFCAAFARPEDAVSAMLVAQRNVAGIDPGDGGLRVRAAIHTGTTDERNGDYFGAAVNRVARLLTIGHGGQVLVSSATTDLVLGDLPPETSLRDLGEHRLRDLARPERVYQLVAPGLAHDFPPLRSLDALPNNLPNLPTSFVGLDSEIAEITALIEEHKLVTLVGSGGVGKTRASLQVAAGLLERWSDGVWFVELAPLTSDDYVVPAVAQALRIALPGEGDPVQNLVRALQSKRALLVFDNCEQVVEAAARVIAAILRGCPTVKIVASSRQALKIAGEVTFRVPSLSFPIPAKSKHLPAAQAARFAAVALFVERARAADNRFHLTDENAPFVADICRRLDGIPLAIELAASRVKVLSPRQLAALLDERFRVLTGGSRDVLPRHQTLRALFDWSDGLLDERERALFRRLGIFVNGFTLEGAAAVGSGEDLDDIDVFDVLASLLDKSLVQADPHGDSLRYRLLESTRAYAVEKLEETGQRDPAERHHLRYLTRRFSELRALAEQTARRTEIYETFGTELEDTRAALDWALARGDVREGAELLAAVGDAWTSVGLDSEGIARIEAYLAALPETESLLLARLATTLPRLLDYALLRDRGVDVAMRAVAHARESGDGAALGWALEIYASTSMDPHHFDEAEEALAEAEAISEAPTALRIDLLQARARLSFLSGDLDSAARMYEQLLEEHRAHGNAHAELWMASNLAEAEHARRETQRAIEITRRALPAARAGAGKAVLATMLHNLAGYLVAGGDLSGAEAAAREALEIDAGPEPNPAYTAVGIEHVALLRALRGDLELAATLEGYADATLRHYSFKREFTERTTYDRLHEILRAELPPADIERCWKAGAALKPRDAIALAIQDAGD